MFLTFQISRQFVGFQLLSGGFEKPGVTWCHKVQAPVVDDIDIHDTSLRVLTQAQSRTSELEASCRTPVRRKRC